MEIGSEIQLNLSDYTSPVEDNVFSYLSKYNTIYVDSGRSALKLLSNSLPDGSVLLPSYICLSVIESFCNRKVDYYSITKDFSFCANELIKLINQLKPKIILIMNYWGKILNQIITRKLQDCCKANKTIIIEDATHSIFTFPLTIGDYCVCSLRKWYPAARGGY